MMLEFVFNGIYLLKGLDQVWFAALGVGYVRETLHSSYQALPSILSGYRM